MLAGGGAAVPLGGYGEVAEVGIQASLGAATALSPSVRAAADAFYVRNGHAIDGDRSEIYGVAVRLGYAFQLGRGLELSPWGGLAGTVHTRKSSAFPGLDASRNGLAVTVGVALSKALGSVSPFLAGSYARGLGALGSERYPTEWLSIGAGVEIPLGID